MNKTKENKYKSLPGTERQMSMEAVSHACRRLRGPVWAFQRRGGTVPNQER